MLDMLFGWDSLIASLIGGLAVVSMLSFSEKNRH